MSTTRLLPFVDAFVVPEAREAWRRVLLEGVPPPRRWWFVTIHDGHGLDAFDVDEATVTWEGRATPHDDLGARALAAAPPGVAPCDPAVVFDLAGIPPTEHEATLASALDGIADRTLWYDVVVWLPERGSALVHDHHDGLRWCVARPVGAGG